MILLYLLAILPSNSSNAVKPAAADHPGINKRLVLEANEVDRLNELFKQSYPSDPVTADRLFHKSILLAKKLHYEKGIGDAHLIKARFLWKANKGKEALESIGLAKKSFLSVSDDLGLFFATALSGPVYMSLNDYDLALSEILESNEIGMRIGADKNQMMKNHFHLIFIYRRFKMNEQARIHFRIGLDLAKETADKKYEGLFHIQMGILENDADHFNDALTEYQKALESFSECGYQSGVLSAKFNIGLQYQELGKGEKALPFFTEILEGYKRLNNVPNTFKVLLRIGRIHSKMGREEEAGRSFQEAFTLFPSLTKMDIQLLYKEYAEHCYRWRRYKEAFDYFSRHIALRDELFSRNREQKILELQEKYESGKKEEEIESLKRDNKFDKLSRNTLIAAFLIMLVILAMLAKKYSHMLRFWKKHKYIGRYRIVERIGSGGMGIVFKCHPVHDRNAIAAVKVLRDEFLQFDRHKARFKREGTIIDQLNHPNIIKIFERGQIDNHLYFAMEYIEGKPLDQIIDGNPPLSIRISLSIMTQIAHALEQMHKRGIVHRDLKPSNIMITDRNENPYFAILLDFGLSKISHHQTKLTETGILVGTLGYQAPEHITERDYSLHSDIYSLGMVFYELATGSPPYRPDDSLSKVLETILSVSPQEPKSLNPEIPPRLNRLIMEMLNKNPQYRPDASSVLHTLQSILIKTRSTADLNIARSAAHTI